MDVWSFSVFLLSETTVYNRRNAPRTGEGTCRTLAKHVHQFHPRLNFHSTTWNKCTNQRFQQPSKMSYMFFKINPEFLAKPIRFLLHASAQELWRLLWPVPRWRPSRVSLVVPVMSKNPFYTGKCVQGQRFQVWGAHLSLNQLIASSDFL